MKQNRQRTLRKLGRIVIAALCVAPAFAQYYNPPEIGFVLKDDFPDSHTDASGNAWELGWGWSGCSPSNLNSVANHFGIVNLFTGSSTGDTCELRLASALPPVNMAGLNSGTTWVYSTVFQITTATLTNQTLKLGLGSSDSDTGNTAPYCAGNCIFAMFDSTVSNNWVLVTCSGGACTANPTSTGAVALNTWYLITIVGNNGTITMTVSQGSNTYTATSSTNVPSGQLTFYFLEKTETGQAANIQLDFVSFFQPMTRY